MLLRYDDLTLDEDGDAHASRPMTAQKDTRIPAQSSYEQAPAYAPSQDSTPDALQDLLEEGHPFLADMPADPLRLLF